MRKLPEDGFADFFSEPLTDEDIQKISGGFSNCSDDNDKVAGWTDMMCEPMAPVGTAKNSGDIQSYPQS